jgi:hypothetical protein
MIMFCVRRIGFLLNRPSAYYNNYCSQKVRLVKFVSIPEWIVSFGSRKRLKSEIGAAFSLLRLLLRSAIYCFNFSFLFIFCAFPSLALLLKHKISQRDELCWGHDKIGKCRCRRALFKLTSFVKSV